MSDQKFKLLRLKVLLSIVEGTSYEEWHNLVRMVEDIYEIKQPDEIATRERVDDYKNVIENMNKFI
ncbi:hypothetical protein QI193_02890 [Staphylococcus saprophyticus]|nr:hypothetical protein [Staphylococcus saprophyticus]